MDNPEVIDPHPYADWPLNGYVIRYTCDGRVLKTTTKAGSIAEATRQAELMLWSLGPRHPGLKATIFEHRVVRTLTWADHHAAPTIQREEFNSHD